MHSWRTFESSWTKPRAAFTAARGRPVAVAAAGEAAGGPQWPAGRKAAAVATTAARAAAAARRRVARTQRKPLERRRRTEGVAAAGLEVDATAVRGRVSSLPCANDSWERHGSRSECDPGRRACAGRWVPLCKITVSGLSALARKQTLVRVLQLAQVCQTVDTLEPNTALARVPQVLPPAMSCARARPCESVRSCFLTRVPLPPEQVISTCRSRGLHTQPSNAFDPLHMKRIVRTHRGLTQCPTATTSERRCLSRDTDKAISHQHNCMY
jgi:hypothetical protein